jgi:NAD(P)H-dependent flavin oxidoreductase YrpB (nitropropane dioxygenase family)
MGDPLQTVLCTRLGCRYPIVQTAMGWIATPELVAASAEAGAFGFLACAVLRPDEVGPAIRRVKALTDRPFGVNFHMFQPGAAQIVDIIIAERVRAVSFGRGPDQAMIQRFRDAGILCIPTVGAAKHARKMVELGVDMITVQGGEGGGHTGSVATNILLPQVLDSVSVPVITAGGFRDGRGLVAALAYGAAGIAMGTRFLLTRESPVPEATKAAYLAAGVDDIIVSTKLDGLPQRMIRNAVLARIERAGRLGMWLRAIESGLDMKRRTGASLVELFQAARSMRSHGGLSLAQALMAANAPMLIQRAVVEGKPEEGVMATGQIGGLIRDLPSCRDLVERIVVEARDRLAALSGETLVVPV